MKKNKNEAWEFLEELVEKTMQWESTNDQLIDKLTSSKGGIYSIESSIATDAKFNTLVRRLEALEMKEKVQVNQTSNQVPMCNGCHIGYVMEECPSFIDHHDFDPEQINATFARPRNDLYAPTYNPRWRNHPNFSWNQQPHQGGKHFSFSQGPPQHSNHFKPNQPVQ